MTKATAVKSPPDPPIKGKTDRPYLGRLGLAGLGWGAEKQMEPSIQGHSGMLPGELQEEKAGMWFSCWMRLDGMGR